MNHDFCIRMATEEDSIDIQKIYAHYVRHTAITFEYEVPDQHEIQSRMITIHKKYPYLVCENQGNIIGYAYANDFRYKAAYQWSPESTIYLVADKTRSGIGKILYRALIDLLRCQGYYNLFAGIALPNDASLRLHANLGFELVGDYKNIGYKLGQWHTTRWFQLILQYHDRDPRPPLSIESLKNQASFNEILNAANKRINSN